MPADVEPTPGGGPTQGDVLIGRYRIDRLLGEGAWARVWLARDLETLSPVAVKLLKSVHSADPGGHEQFDHEAAVLARLRSPHIVRIASIEQTSTGLPFLVMEYVRGLSVRQILLRHGPLDPGSVARLADGVLRALKVAHAEGLVHRDIKPSNLLVTKAPGSNRPIAKVVDFGVATALSEGVSSMGEDDDGMPLFCSPRYAAPEVLDGRPTAASDLYSLGIVLAEMLEGEAPWPHEDPLDVARLHLSDAVVPLGPAVQSSGLVEVIATATQKSLNARFADASEMLAALHRAAAAPSKRETVTGAYHSAQGGGDRDAAALAAPPDPTPLAPPAPAAETRPVVPAALRRAVRGTTADAAVRRAALPGAPVAELDPSPSPSESTRPVPAAGVRTPRSASRDRGRPAEPAPVRRAREAAERAAAARAGLTAARASEPNAPDASAAPVQAPDVSDGVADAPPSLAPEVPSSSVSGPAAAAPPAPAAAASPTPGPAATASPAPAPAVAVSPTTASAPTEPPAPSPATSVSADPVPDARAPAAPATADTPPSARGIGVVWLAIAAIVGAVATLAVLYATGVLGG